MNKLITITTILLSFTAISLVESNRVIGGSKVNLGDYPWQAAIYYDDVYLCAGSLISKKHILTTKNCLEPYEYFPNILSAHVGVLVAGDAKNERQGHKIYLAEPPSPFVYDVVAILELDEEVEIGTDILAITTLLTEKLQHMDEVKLSGWGLDDDTIYYELHDAHLKIEAISNVCDVDGSRPICTYGMNWNLERVGPCKWDEGSGLVKFESSLNDHVLIGVVKHTNKCSAASPNESKYIPTEPFIDWIYDTMKE